MMKQHLYRSIGLLILIGGSFYALSPRLMFCDNAADARRDADRRRRQQEDIRRDEERRRIRQEEESTQERRLTPDFILASSESVKS